MYVANHTCTCVWTAGVTQVLLPRQAQEHFPTDNNSETCTRHMLQSLPARLNWTQTGKVTSHSCHAATHSWGRSAVGTEALCFPAIPRSAWWCSFLTAGMSITQGCWASPRLQALPEADPGCCSHRKGSTEDKQSRSQLCTSFQQRRTLCTGTVSFKRGETQSWQS